MRWRTAAADRAAGLDRVFHATVHGRLARPPHVPPEGRQVITGRRDPITHARRLAYHFEAPLVLLEGGHLLQVGRSDGFRALGRLLDSLSVTGSPS